jgi:hypothetical protein
LLGVCIIQDTKLIRKILNLLIPETDFAMALTDICNVWLGQCHALEGNLFLTIFIPQHHMQHKLNEF